MQEASDEISRMLLRHAAHENMMAWVYAALTVLIITALAIRWWRGGPPPF